MGGMHCKGKDVKPDYQQNLSNNIILKNGNQMANIKGSLQYFRIYLDEIKLNSSDWDSIKVKFDNNQRKLKNGNNNCQYNFNNEAEPNNEEFHEGGGGEEEEENYVQSGLLGYNTMNNEVHEKIASQFPLGMHIMDEYFNYHFWVPDCFQSRVDFVEVNHIPVSDIGDLQELRHYLCERDWVNSAEEADLLRSAAKDTNRMRKIISIKCKFDIELKVSDFFWSNKGQKVRAYGIIGPTWTSVFSAFCYFEQTSGFCKSMITTDLKSDLFIDKVIASNRYYCPEFHSFDEYCFGYQDEDQSAEEAEVDGYEGEDHTDQIHDYDEEEEDIEEGYEDIGDDIEM